jgi:hypothetical protein
MQIQVLGLGHVKSELTVEIIRQVLSEESIDINVERINGCKNVALYGVYLTPSVIMNGVVKCAGRIPKKDEVRGWIIKTAEKNA